DDLHILPDAEARKLDEIPRQIDNLHRLTHVEDKDLAPLAEYGGLQDELHRLGNGHEEALDIGVGHRDRPAAGDLLAEGEDDAAPAAEDVAEPDRDVGPAGLAGRLVDQQLGDALGYAHHAGRVDGLVGGDHHKMLDAQPFGRP